MTRALILAIAATLAGCSSMPEVRVPPEVKVSVPVPCIAPEKLPARPALRTTGELDALPDYHYVYAVEADRVVAGAYIRELEAIAVGCSRIPATAAPGR